MAKVYYNQRDSRWANHPYTSANHPYATIGTSGCGATCAAMVVSSCREIVTPDVMGDISKQNGYRALEGTSDGLFTYISSRWGIEMKRLKSSFEAHEACKQGYFVVIACGAGLWTTGGHYILAVGANDSDIEIYDPYLYRGKFNTASRRGKVRVSGVSAWVEINTFKAYSNAQRFFAFKINTSSNLIIHSNSTDLNRIAWVNTKILPLNVRNVANGQVVGKVGKGTQVTVHEINGSWARIDQGWVNTQYLSYNQTTPQYHVTVKYVKVNTSLNIRKSANAGSVRVGSLANGTKVIVYEERNGWSRIGTNQWVASQYLVSQSSKAKSSGYKLGRYKVVANVLNVRVGASKDTARKKTYKKNTVFDTYEIKGSWARTPSGWVCLDYCKLLYKY